MNISSCKFENFSQLLHERLLAMRASSKIYHSLWNEDTISRTKTTWKHILEGAVTKSNYRKGQRSNAVSGLAAELRATLRP